MERSNLQSENGVLLEDRKVMVDFYQSLSEKYRKDGECVDGDTLVNILSNVSRAEDQYGGWGARASIPGSSFTSWVDDETHYAMERDGHKWVSDLFKYIVFGKFEGEVDKVNEAYSQMRERVLRAVVLKAVEFFPVRDKNSWQVLPSEWQNLRCSLKDYLHLVK
ncbi:MAG: hypothetical protein AABY26_02855 [Nanoarchaeota archaeon]